MTKHQHGYLEVFIEHFPDWLHVKALLVVVSIVAKYRGAIFCHVYACVYMCMHMCVVLCVCKLVNALIMSFATNSFYHVRNPEDM